MKLKRQMYGPDDPRGPTKGADVQILKWGLWKYEDNFFKPPPHDQIYNAVTAQAVKTLQQLERGKGNTTIKVATGNVGQPTWDVVWNYLDAYRKYRYLLFKVPVPPPPILVEPRQGWASLVKELWGDYSLARNMGLTDLGTYNPSSKLPSGAPSDHAYFPAYAFDVGFTPQTGMNNQIAKAFFNSMVGRPEVSYVICGNSIWSQEKGLHSYTYGGHEGHVHVSGIH